MALPLIVNASFGARRTQMFGGLELEFIIPRQRNQDLALMCCFLSTFVNVNLVTSLSRQTYGKSQEFQQSVIDALSPFQIASKMWAANALHSFLSAEVNTNVFYLGSWFGVQSIFDHHKILHLDDVHKTYVDIDSLALQVSEELHHNNRTNNNSEWLNQSVWDMASEEFPENSVIVWTGIEHFDLIAIQEFIDKAPRDVRWILQGTNMPAADHINLVNSTNDLSKYFNADPFLLGEIKTPIGSRFMAVY